VLYTHTSLELDSLVITTDSWQAQYTTLINTIPGAAETSTQDLIQSSRNAMKGMHLIMSSTRIVFSLCCLFKFLYVSGSVIIVYQHLRKLPAYGILHVCLARSLMSYLNAMQIACILLHAVPYSGKHSRQKTFVDQ
jgi:hypothetical protein